MKVFYKLICLTLAAACTSSCAEVKSFMTSHSGRPDISAEELSHQLHPRGTIRQVFYKTSVKGPSHRRMLVYLPEGYESSPERRYPVLYLLHGARGNETSWLVDGNLARINDSLQTAGLTDAFITVLPNMNQYDDDRDFANSRFKRPIESLFGPDGAVEASFTRDVVATVDSLFRTIPEKEGRAIAGLSIGGLQAINISANQPYTFDAIALFSPMHKAFIKASDYSDYYWNLRAKQRVQFSKPPRLYSIYIGKKDIFYFNVEYYRRYMHSNNFPFQYTETRGGHDWTRWRNFYTMFIQTCF